ncbi:hypothetical protein D592_06847 [Staphylococcus epidermidis 36-1]|nr:hypothetical protein D592_06847 [Staphylococcus epidermidis 36-1]
MSKNKKQSLQSAHQKPLLKKNVGTQSTLLNDFTLFTLFLDFQLYSNDKSCSGIQRFPLRYWYHRR